jgi:hypothetical protein
MNVSIYQTKVRIGVTAGCVVDKSGAAPEPMTWSVSDVAPAKSHACEFKPPTPAPNHSQHEIEYPDLVFCVLKLTKASRR